MSESLIENTDHNEATFKNYIQTEEDYQQFKYYDGPSTQELEDEQIYNYDAEQSSDHSEVKQEEVSNVVQQKSTLNDDQIAKRLLKKKKNARRFQYNYYKKRKRSIPTQIIRLEENGLKVCLRKEMTNSMVCQFSGEEDEKILQLVLQYGPKFSKIAKYFPRKTLSMVKNRYYKCLRYQWEEVLGEEYKHLSLQKANNLESNQKFEEIQCAIDKVQLFPDAYAIMENFLQQLASYK